MKASRAPHDRTQQSASEREAPVVTGVVAAHRHAHAHDHAVQFYEDDTFLATAVCEFLVGGLKSGQPAVVIATPAHRKSFVSRLRAQGIDVAAARRSGQLTLLDARQTLNRFMNGPTPDGRRFRAVIGAVIEKSLGGREGASVCAYGEMVDLLWKEGNAEGAIRLEDLWNTLAKSYDFSLLCAYNMGNFARAADAEQFGIICAQHTHVVPTERYIKNDDAGRLVEISVLQQRARALEAEIQHREMLEQRLRETVIALQNREEDLRDVLENAAEGIHLVNAEGFIQWANNAELEMLGYRAEEYIGQHISSFYVDADVIEDLLARLARGESVREYRARLRRNDGSVRHVLVNSNVRWEDGKFVHTRCFTRDITEIHEAAVERERALEREQAIRAEAERARAEAERARAEAERANADAQRARSLAEQANRAKGEFLAVMSHELRTPLNAIGGYAELMELGIHGPITPQQRESLERVQRSQRMLLGLVNQVLNYARVETGNVRYDFADIPLDEVLRSAESLIAPQVRMKGLRLSYSGCEGDVTVHVDGDKLQQIMLNLLTNAVKFTDTGGAIRLDVECDQREIRLHVADTGIGIAADKWEVIFDPFIQVDANYTRTRDGVGLGLAISRDLARGMGGDLSVRSVPGEGSTFTLTIPRSI
jgi:PAS domain S-box-containing protein